MKHTNDITIKVEGLSKRFGDVETVTAVDFEVASGELFGFLWAKELLGDELAKIQCCS